MKKRNTFKGWKAGGVFALGLLVLIPLHSNGSEELKKRLQETQAQLKQTRESLHVAQRELAAKSERITDLEAELLKGKGKRVADSADAAKRPVREPSKERKRAAGKSAPAEPSGDGRESFAFSYETNSAVNYEEREAALRWVRQKLKEDSGRSFRISGRANDSIYPQANETIAMNRARFLKDFLVLKGIPEDLILPVSGVESKEEGGKGRVVQILCDPGKAPKTSAKSSVKRGN